MPKRKRDFDEEKAIRSQPSAESVKLGPYQQRVLYKFQQSAIKLGHAVKLARGLERQKLGRRSKTAQSDGNQNDVQRLDAEIRVLKDLDNAVCARNYLSKSLIKIKAVADSPRLPKQLAEPENLSTDTAALNVHARLYNSNPVKDALPQCIADVTAALGLKPENLGAKKKRMRAKDYEVKAQEEKVAEERKDSRPASPPDRDKNTTPVAEGNAALDSDDDFAGFSGRLASSHENSEYEIDLARGDSADSESDSDNEDLDIRDLERQLESEGLSRRNKPSKRSADPPTIDLSLSEYDSQDDDDDEDQESIPEATRARAPAPKTSSFIPSLSAGGYISGSDSDIDNEIDVAPPRKNRPGQRARQQIWEKKYGAKAKHLQRPPKDNWSDGWDSKAGATTAGGQRGGQGRDRFAKGGYSRSDSRPQSGRPGEVVQRHGAGPPPKHRDDKGSIHPSWEAAKKAKEKREAPVAFQGKKVVFD